MGGSVIRLDIPRDAVSVVCNIKSTRGNTSVNMTPWESKAQYKRWNRETYKPHNQASDLIDQSMLLKGRPDPFNRVGD